MNYIKDNNGCWTVVLGGQVFTFDKHHQKHDELVNAIRSKDEATFSLLISIGKTIQNWSKDGFVLKNGVLFYGEEELAKPIASIVMDMIQGGFEEFPILNFMKKLFQNPSNRAVSELYSWLEHKSLAIHADGDFLAYKSLEIHSGESFVDCYGREVKDGDYVDKYTRKIRNNIGDVNEMPRRKVNDNFQVGCSEGFHVGSLNYVQTQYSSNKTVICKVNPADVVSVPLDCSCQKIRCSKYLVLSEFKVLDIVEEDEKIIPVDEEVENDYYEEEDDEDDAFYDESYNDHQDDWG